jgi:SGNH hydrolase-like domain, acetyltransferase AlgX
MSQPSRRLLLLNIVLFMAMAIAPVTAMFTPWRDVPIYGERGHVARPKLSLASVVDDKFQPAAEAWFQRYLGLTGTWIGADNALLYYFFGETKHGSTVRMGDDNVLFIDEDIDFYNKHGVAVTTPAYVNRLAERLAALQRAMARHGKALVPVIIPSKTTIYRDKISTAWTAELGQPRPTDVATYNALRLALAANGVRYVDGRQMLLDRPEERYVIWGPQARHWSMYAACLVVSEAATLYAQLTGKLRPAQQCELVMKQADPRTDSDFDLLRLANALFIRPTYRDIPTIRYPQPLPDAEKPRVLMVGTSFCWQIGGGFHQSGVWGELYFNFYQSHLYRLADMYEEPIAVDQPLWRAATLGADIIVLDLFESYLMGGTYVDQFLDHAGPRLMAGEKP